LSVVEQYDAVEMKGPQPFPRVFRLKRREVELSGEVPAENKLHESVAKMTYAVKQNYGPHLS